MLKKVGVTMQLLDDKGKIIETGIYTKVEDKDGYKKLEDVNLPTLDQSFYVKFKTTADIKNISIEVEVTYLDKCTAEAYYYIGTEYEYKWEDITTTDVCCKETHKAGDHTINGEPCDGTDNPIIHYYHQYQLKKVDTQVDPQMLIGLEISYNEEGKMQVEANKNWKTISSKNRDNPPPTTDITMDLGGYVWIDQDQGKVNEGNAQLDDLDNLGNKTSSQEVLPGAEVWLYEYTEQNGQLKGIMLTDENGHYSFTGLNAQKKYYVKFVYNGMMYDSVEYNKGNPEYNTSGWYKTSKAKEDERQTFNSKFEEIGSYPSNYKIINKMFGDDLGDYNTTFLQEDIQATFKELSQAILDVYKDGVRGEQNILEAACERLAGDNETEVMRRKIQFAADCRISAYTDRSKYADRGEDNLHDKDGAITTNYIYPVYDLFTTTSTKDVPIGNITYKPIYEGQRYINLGIKARATFDMALYKDVLKADVQINGKTETYTYDSRKGSSNGFSVGVSEGDYLNGLRNAYRSSEKYKNDNQTRDIENDTYDLNMRTEEITNGESGGYNYGLDTEDKLKIFVTYKLSIRNQSSIVGAVTEIVDYYDTNYSFVQAYVGDVNGNKTGDVTKSDSSMYGNEYKSTKNSYNTIYLRPTETRLSNGEEQYIYVVLQLLRPLNDAGTLLSSKLLNGNTLNVINLAEINGYKTYNSKSDNASPGLVDIDSNPGNLNISNIDALTQDNIVNYPNIKSMYEDDTSRAPVLIFKKYDSRTLEGTVFEDSTGKNERVYTNDDRKGDGEFITKDGDIGIDGVIVKLYEVKKIENGEQWIPRAQTITGDNPDTEEIEKGWYRFSGFLPGDYRIRYEYGKDDNTAMIKDVSIIAGGQNDKSYNGQDYESTLYEERTGYTDEATKTNYWYAIIDDNDNIISDTKRYSDAEDNTNRRNEIVAYSNTYAGKESKEERGIINHKAEVFNSYKAEDEQQAYIRNLENKETYVRDLASELESYTYCYADTQLLPIEVEFVKTTVAGNTEHEYKITNIDFGIVERPKSELVLDQKIEKIKVTAADGTVLFDVYDAKNADVQWITGSNTNGGYNGSKITGGNNRTAYEIGEKVSITMDEELISGSKLEITYKLVVTNNGEKDGDSTTSATTVLNYVSNNLNFDESINNGWEVVNIQDIQNGNTSTYVNSKSGIDLTTQAVILKTNALNKQLAPGEQTSCTLTLSKVLSAESSSDDLKYTNLAEIVEINNTVGRYDHGAIPGNQNVDEEPQEHDTAGGSNDGEVVVIPPTGSQYIYYVIGITSAIILGLGIFLIKKFVIKK